MKTQLFTDSQFGQMAREVVQVLEEVGYWVDHPQVKTMAQRAGCRESAGGRLLFDRRQVAELRARLEEQYPPVPPGTPERSLIHPRQSLALGFGNLTPKYFNYAQDRPESGSIARLTELIRFAHVEPRITSITIPLSRPDAAPYIEQMESVLLMARLTEKKIGATDATVPESIPFLAEMGQALGHDPAVFIGCCNCINPPLRLEYRTAETMLHRRRYHSRSMITPMPAIGGSGPVDIYGCIILATAEIVGGLILSMLIDPEAPLLGYIACTQVDMRSGNATSSTPQTVRVDAGVYQLMQHSFGGGTGIGGRSYVSARRPGLQAVFERFLKAVGYSALADGHAFGYAGNGNLDNGSMLSPEQFLLDLETMQGLNWLWTAPNAASPGDGAQRIRDIVLNEGGNFLTSEHTAIHYRDEMWSPAWFQYRIDTWNEKHILDKCHIEYLETVERYQPASYPDDVLRELETILEKARQLMTVGNPVRP